MITLPATDQQNALFVALQANVPVLLIGEPGVGKTKTVEQMGAVLNWHVETLIAVLHETTDFSGMPAFARTYPEIPLDRIATSLAPGMKLEVADLEQLLSVVVQLFGAQVSPEGGIRFVPPKWALRLKELGEGILFLDEISSLRPAVQTALLRVVLEKTVGELQLPSSIRIVAAANPPDQMGGGGFDLMAPLANRFCFLEWKLDHHQWLDGYMYGWPVPALERLPNEWKREVDVVKPLIAGFLRGRMEHIQRLPQTEAERGQPWPSGRSWQDMATPLYAAARAGAYDEEVQRKLLRGSVGNGAATEFFTWLAEAELPDPMGLLNDPHRQELPARDDRLYAALGSMIFTLVATEGVNNPTRWANAWKVCKRAVDEGKPKDVVAAHIAQLAIPANRPNGAAVPPEAREFVDILRKAGVIGGAKRSAS